MDDDRLAQLPWLPALTAEVRKAFDNGQEAKPMQRAALECERDELQQKRDGWSQSLGNPDLSPAVRAALEGDYNTALERLEEINVELAENDCEQQTVEELINPERVLQRIERLPEVLAKHSVNLGNLELALHIDTITCHPDGKVEMRTCKLGAMTEAIEILAIPNAVEQGDAPAVDPNGRVGLRTRRRKRSRLRVADAEYGSADDLRILTQFAADPDRFAGLGEEWFWIDTFQIPESNCWSKENAGAVLRRYEELRQETGKQPSLSKLAREFGVSRPTIQTALRLARGEEAPKVRGARNRSRVPLSDGTRNDIIRLHREKVQDKEIAAVTGAHRNTVARLIQEWYTARGEKRPDGRRTRWNR